MTGPHMVIAPATSIDATQRKLIVGIVIATLMALAIVIADLASGGRPVWVIASMESPGAIEQSSCGAQRRRIRAAADRQVGDHAAQHNHADNNDPDREHAAW